MLSTPEYSPNSDSSYHKSIWGSCYAYLLSRVLKVFFAQIQERVRGLVKLHKGKIKKTSYEKEVKGYLNSISNAIFACLSIWGMMFVHLVVLLLLWCSRTLIERGCSDRIMLVPQHPTELLLFPSQCQFSCTLLRWPLEITAHLSARRESFIFILVYHGSSTRCLLHRTASAEWFSWE